MDSPKVSDLVVTRVFDAPVERVWQAWTDPKHLSLWWGPKDFTAPAIQLDLREGGKYLYCMRGPDGKDYWTTGTFQEIVPLKRLVYTDSFSDEHGNIVPASYYGMEGDFPLEMVVTVLFEELPGKTKMILKHSGMPEDENKEMTGQGWNESFDKMVDSLLV
ncbi:SRPBCC domain-containing protein [bacterium]|nr:SRPBCC domain-containing protein [bacterium]